MDDILDDVENNILVFVDFAVFLREFIGSIDLTDRLCWLGLSILSPFDLFNSSFSFLSGHLPGINITIDNIKNTILVDIIVLNCLIICQDSSSIYKVQSTFIKTANRIALIWLLVKSDDSSF